MDMTTRGLRNNNPGNIEINGDTFMGEVVPSKDTRFKQFREMRYGYRAIFCIMQTYIRRYGLNTIEGMISRWAPNNENDTDGYIRFVSEKSGIPPTDPVDIANREHMIRIVAAISQMENGVEADMADVIAGWEAFRARL